MTVAKSPEIHDWIASKDAESFITVIFKQLFID